MNYDKLYAFAYKIAGQNGDDLLHHTLVENDFFRKVDAVNIYAYIYQVMRNEYYNKKSNFNKKYNLRQDEIEVFEFDSTGYSIQDVHRILLQLENEGYNMQVSVFRESFFNIGLNKLAERTDVHQRTIRRINKWVSNEIKQRYEC